MANIITTAQALAQMPDGVDSSSTRFTLAVSGASAALDRLCGRVWHTTTFAAWHSGYAAANLDIGGKTYRGRYALYLVDPATRLATLPVTAVSSVTEDGDALTAVLLSTATSFTDSEDVAIVDGVRGIVWRARVSSGVPEPVEWAAGVANIRVGYTAGFKSTDEKVEGVSDVPDDIIQATAHVAALVLREGWRTGISAQGEMGGTVSYDRLLLPVVKELIHSYRIPPGPMTLAG